MIRSDAYGGLPGYSQASETFESRFRWSREGLGIIVGINLSGAARDATNTPTTVLRSGLVLAQLTASGLWQQYVPGAADGSQDPAVILLSSFRMQDLDGNNVNRFVWALAQGPVIAAQLIGLDAAARTKMRHRFFFDDELANRTPVTLLAAEAPPPAGPDPGNSGRSRGR